MNFNCVTSGLSLIGCSITNLNIENSITSLTKTIEKNLGFDIVPIELLEDENNRYGKILLKVVIVLKDSGETVCKIELETEGLFSSPLSVREEEFKKLLLVNGATALYGIARGKIENISAATFSDGKITIPFVNIIDFYKEKNKETTEC